MKLDFIKLLEYSKRMEVSVVTRRIGYALELLELAKEISSQITSNRSKDICGLIL